MLGIVELLAQVGEFCSLAWDVPAHVDPLPAPWVAVHLLQLAVALIPTALRHFMKAVDDWLIPTLLLDFHKGLAERLAEVVRRRETVVGLARLAAGASTAPGAPFAPSRIRHATSVWPR